MSDPLAQLQRRLDYRFQDPALLAEALTHRSFAPRHNERLEFLGDSVLNCVIAGALFARFPDLPEGDLSRLRAGLVRQDTLFEIAQELHLGDYLRLGEGELKSGGFRRPSILADALEAIIGAAFLDRGFDAAAELVRRRFASRLDGLDAGSAGKDPKTALQEWLQGRRLPLPAYSLVATRGEAHAQEFEAQCRVEALRLESTGRGPSRRAAEQAAAGKMLELLPRK